MFYSDLVNEIIHRKNIEAGLDEASSIHEKLKYNMFIEHFSIENEHQAKIYNKEIGEYDLMFISDILFLSKKQEKYAENELSKIFSKYLQGINNQSKVLIVGLGNRHISADSLGAKVVSKVNITFLCDNFPQVMAICPSVLGLTGIETSDIVAGVVAKVKPTHIILIDSLCASAPERLGRSIQITNNGICPGSGIGNKRKCIDKRLCENIVSIGVPLLIYSSTFIEQAFYNNKIDYDVIQSIMQNYKKQGNNKDILCFFENLKNMFNQTPDNMIVSIKDIEECVQVLSNIISNAINIALGVNFE